MVQKNQPPPTNTIRWTAVLKMQILTAVQNGSLTLEKAREDYDLSKAELKEWEENFAREGIVGLQVRAKTRRT